MYSITSVAKLVGVDADTLRNWERRYSFLSPNRDSRGIRVYSDADVELLKRISALIARGARIGDISERVRKGELLPAVQPVVRKIPEDTQCLIEEFYRALLVVDSLKIDYLHDNLKVSLSFLQMLEFVYAPIKERLETDYELKKIGLAEVKFCSTFIRQIIFGFLSTPNGRRNRRSHRIVCAALPGDLQERGLMMAAAYLKFRGWEVFYLGCDVQVSEIQRFSERMKSAVFLSVSKSETLYREMPKIRAMGRKVFLSGNGVIFTGADSKPEGDLHFLSASGISAAERLIRSTGSIPGSTTAL